MKTFSEETNNADLSRKGMKNSSKSFASHGMREIYLKYGEIRRRQEQSIHEDGGCGGGFGWVAVALQIPTYKREFREKKLKPLKCEKWFQKNGSNYHIQEEICCLPVDNGGNDKKFENSVRIKEASSFSNQFLGKQSNRGAKRIEEIGKMKDRSHAN